jgi:D-sedoheptulose 7-phosphate isomerase
LCIEAYAPTDNVSELTARTNDEGWKRSLSNERELTNPSMSSALVGGGDSQ